MTKPPLKFAYFTSFCPAGPPGTMWHHPAAQKFDYLALKDWVALAKTLEDAKFDALFWADHSGVHDVYGGSWATAVREAVQFPEGDPAILAAAMAGATTDLGFAFSSNIIQDHPYSFARKLTTLDHLTEGRIAWNIVTASQESAWRNFGYDGVASHSERYERAEEYVTVVYKLLEGSWEDDAVVRDVANKVFAEPEKIHDIEHSGRFYRVPGIHTNEPSPQRVPVLFQAGTSEDGREFSSRNAEVIFMSARNPIGAKKVIDDVRERAVRHGRNASDLLFMQSAIFVIGSTEEEARRKNEEIDEHLSIESDLTFYSTLLSTDLAKIDLDAPIGDLKTEANQGGLKALKEAAPNKDWTFREVVRGLTGSQRFVGTPEQLVAWLNDWRDAGVGGINLAQITGMGEAKEMLDEVVPVLRENGLIQREYAPGTLREKFFGGGARLSDRHPASRFRH